MERSASTDKLPGGCAFGNHLIRSLFVRAVNSSSKSCQIKISANAARSPLADLRGVLGYLVRVGLLHLLTIQRKSTLHARHVESRRHVLVDGKICSSANRHRSNANSVKASHHVLDVGGEA